MGELSGTEDFEEEQAYADRLNKAIERGMNPWLKSYNDVTEKLLAAGVSVEAAEGALYLACETGRWPTPAGVVVSTPGVGYTLQ